MWDTVSPKNQLVQEFSNPMMSFKEVKLLFLASLKFGKSFSEDV